MFLYEFVEGNTLTRVQFRRTLRVARSLGQDQPITEEIRRDARTFIGRLAHFLDIPMVSTIVFFGVVRPDSWLTVGIAIGVAIAIALVLMIVGPRLAEGPAASKA